MNLFAVVFADELEKEGRGVIYFNVKTPNVNFKHYAVVQHKSGAQQPTIDALLAKVRVDYPKAGDEDADRAVWILREPRQPVVEPAATKSRKRKKVA